MASTASAAEPILRMTGIAKSFAGVRALDGVDFEVRAGEIHALIGENGAGKSTLMNVLAGRFEDWGGEVYLEGRPIRPVHPRQALQLGIAVIYQERSLLPGLTVAENIMLGQEPRGRWPGTLARGALVNEARRTLDQLGFDLPPNRPVEELSTARQTLVEVARAMRRSARILVFDEPTASLGSEDVQRLFLVIRHLASRGIGIVYISHRLAELPRIADRVTVLRDGRVVGTRSMSQCRVSDLASMMFGRDLAEIFPPRVQEPGRTVLRVRDLTRRGAFDRISFDLHEGEILALAGLVGSGRTEIARAIVGADTATGIVEFEGKVLARRTPRLCRQLGICMVPEDRKRDGSITGRPVAENLNVCVLDRLAGALGYVSPRLARDGALAMMNRMRIEPRQPTIEIQRLSGGNQQKAIVGRALAIGPKVLIYDEPTQGIDIRAKAEVYRLIADSAAAGQAIILISSELIEIAELAHRILVIREGRIVDELSGGDMDEESLFSACVGEVAR
jgi:ABC-type sugar transport system ATPase subunit